MNVTGTLSPDDRDQVRAAIRTVRKQIRWKSGKDVEHLETRKRYGHLAPDATIDDYHAVITELQFSDSAELYAFLWKDTLYPTVVSAYERRTWLVMFSINGVLETAFQPTDAKEYLSDPRFLYMGPVMEFLR